MIRIEHRRSDSPFIAQVWRAHASGVETMTSVANSTWELVVWTEGEQLLTTVRGPETRASTAPVPHDSSSLGILFAHGVHMPHLPVTGLVDAETPPRPVRGSGFRLRDGSYPLPTYEAAEQLVDRLVADGVLVRDSLVADVLDGLAPTVSPRTVQRRVHATTGLTLGTIRQIARAREAALRLGDGEPILEVVHDLGFYDQSHLSRALGRFIGRTATQLARGRHAQPLSLLYSPREGTGFAGPVTGAAPRRTMETPPGQG
ncbi:MAG TPA: helix-turn-helix domain-containing protein [Candidatus Brachybacterium intestinipullorum]|uniref:Helix-turn-helix domain-containing protein n=1 Tax=Candidatus Brachybacterium intestinipullorum TaxID=2838512 RepID=A0A9D2PWG4_9MICO|nr:helix-turn-helix domain-containing protein [Candidatus Brachybacterium intestinipullorum]